MKQLILLACFWAVAAGSLYGAPSNYLAKIQESVDIVKSYNASGLEKAVVGEACYGELGCFEIGKGCTGYVPFTLPHGPDFLETELQIYVKADRYRVVHRVPWSEEPDLSLVPEGASVFILTHGYTMHGENPLMTHIVRGASRHFDAVIVMDWWKGASVGGLYMQSVRDTEVVARQMALVVDRLQKNRKIKGEEVVLSGFSLGGQIVGYAGARLQEKYGINPNRIIPIDPAGPLYEGFGCHVNPSNAKWVTVIHASGGWNLLVGELGMFSPVGHIDWYPNGGTRQPGCGQLVVDHIICHHFRACELMAASLDNYCRMDSKPCGSWDDYKAGKCDHLKADSEFGWPASRGAAGSHYLETTDHYPFCIGH